MEYSNTFSALLPTPSAVKEGDTYTETEVKEEAGLESYSRNPLWAAFRKGIYGWKAGLILGLTSDAVVFIITMVFTLTSALAFPRSGSQAILIDGDCTKSKSYSIWLHLLINVLSTILLASSSYAMQCAISPTKGDLKMAHTKGRYMTIGAPNLRNLTQISRYRSLLFSVAILSSLPIHLLANSVVFQTFGTDSYLLAVAYEQFLQTPADSLIEHYGYRLNSFHSDRTWYGGHLVNGSLAQGGNPNEDIVPTVDLTHALKALSTNMTRLENADCIRTYSEPLVAGWRHVLAIADQQPPPNTNTTNFNYLAQQYYQSVDICPDCQTYLNYTDPTLWTCAFTDTSSIPSRGCDSSKAVSDAGNFRIENTSISYCMAEPVPQRCQLQADIRIASVLLGFIFVKICVLLAILVKLPDGTIATLGDAIAAFLTHPDSTTEASCLLSRGDVLRHTSDSPQKHSLPYHDLVERWKPGQPFRKHWSSSTLANRWSAGPRVRQWAVALLLLLAILVVYAVFLDSGINRLKTRTGLQGVDLSGVGSAPSDAASLWRMGFGTVNPNFLLNLPGISSNGGTIRHVLLVNTPQLLLSIFYFAYNSVWTQMMLAREWAQFGRKRQGLRVSGQILGQQRSNYFLTIPYQAAVPLQLVSALLHWLLSQSFFLARVNVYSGQPFVDYPPSIINTVGYSLMALVFLIALWGVMLIAVIAAGCLGRLKSPMPVVGGNSLAISAACHPPVGSSEIETKELMWGVVPEMEVDGIKHCSFSASEVYSPADSITVDEKYGSGFKVTDALFT